MFRKACVIFAAGVFLLNAFAAEKQVQDLVDCENPAEWEGMVKLNEQITHSGKYSFELYGKYPTEVICKQMIPVDFSKTYKLSVRMRTLDKQFPASGFFGLRMYDKDKRPINFNNVAVIPDTETTLADDAAQGTKEISIVKNAAWLKLKDASVAFNVQDKYQDLPNFDLCRVDKVIDEGAQYKVILRQPLNKACPAGAKIRLHSPWGAPFYWVAQDWMPAEWKPFSATLQGEAEKSPSSTQFWRGTKYVRVFAWFGNYNRIPDKNARLLVDDIKFTCE